MLFITQRKNKNYEQKPYRQIENTATLQVAVYLKYVVRQMVMEAIIKNLLI